MYTYSRLATLQRGPYAENEKPRKQWMLIFVNWCMTLLMQNNSIAHNEYIEEDDEQQTLINVSQYTQCYAAFNPLKGRVYLFYPLLNVGKHVFSIIL